MKISVIGAGAFGTAMAAVAARYGNEVLLWAHDPKVADAVQRTKMNPSYLRDVVLGDSVHATGELAEAARFSDAIFMVTPSHHYRRVLSELATHIVQPVSVISGTKGIENETLERMSEVTTACLGPKLRRFAALSGPTFATEVARGDPTAAVIASSLTLVRAEPKKTKNRSRSRLKLTPPRLWFGRSGPLQWSFGSPTSWRGPWTKTRSRPIPRRTSPCSTRRPRA